MTTKSKSRQRFEQLNHITDHMISKLPTATHGLVLVVCWRHADQNQVFELSHSRIADALGVSRRHIVDVMVDLQAVDSIRLLRKGGGTRASRYKITGRVVTAASPPERHKPP